MVASRRYFIWCKQQAHKLVTCTQPTLDANKLARQIAMIMDDKVARERERTVAAIEERLIAQHSALFAPEPGTALVCGPTSGEFRLSGTPRRGWNSSSQPMRRR